MRPNHRRSALQAGQGPEQREDDGGDRKPAPQPGARQRKRCRGDHREIDVKRPEIRLARRHQHRRDEGRGDAKPGQRRPVQQRRRERAECDKPQQDERGCGREEIIERISRIDGGERDRRAGRGQDRRDVGDRQRLDVGDALRAPRPFAGSEQREREQAAQRGADARPEQSRLDRIAHQEEAAERQRQAADPHHPARADAFLETGLRLWQRRRSACANAVRRAARERRGRRNGFERRRLHRRQRQRQRRGRDARCCEILRREWRRRCRCRGARLRGLQRIEPRPELVGAVERFQRQQERADRDRNRKQVQRPVEHLLPAFTKFPASRDVRLGRADDCRSSAPPADAEPRRGPFL